MRIREYGKPGSPVVILLHGGPGAPGYLAPVARRLADSFQVLEPFQRRSSGTGVLTVAVHVEDLLELVQSRCPAARPALVGHSWGAMLALAFAAEHPRAAAGLALVGCGTFDAGARQSLEKTRQSRMDPGLRERMARLALDFPDPDARLQAVGRLYLRLDSHRLVSTELELERCDACGNEQTWEDMLGLQQAGVYPAAFAAIGVPVLMLHGSADPHPGRLIRASLEPYLPQLECREWEPCGHYPWLEEAVADEFFSTLRGWLGRL